MLDYIFSQECLSNTTADEIRHTRLAKDVWQTTIRMLICTRSRNKQKLLIFFIPCPSSELNVLGWLYWVMFVLNVSVSGKCFEEKRAVALKGNKMFRMVFGFYIQKDVIINILIWSNLKQDGSFCKMKQAAIAVHQSIIGSCGVGQCQYHKDKVHRHSKTK